MSRQPSPGQLIRAMSAAMRLKQELADDPEGFQLSVESETDVLEILDRICEKALADRVLADLAQKRATRIKKRAKRLRYTFEFVANQDSRAARRFLRRLVRLQDLLGGHQDAEVAVVHLRALAQRASVSPGLTFAMGQLAQRNAVEAGQLRASFERTYEPVVGKQWRKLYRRLNQAAD